MRGLPLERELDEQQRRVSARLHSSITQSLAALTANLDLIAGGGHGLTAARRGLLEETRTIARDCFQQLRALADELHPPIVADVGLRRAVATFVGDYVERTHVPVTYEMDECPRLPEEVEMAIYRLVVDCLDDLHLSKESVSGAVTLRSRRRAVELTIVPATLDSAIRWRQYLGTRFFAKVDAHVMRRGGKLAFVIRVPLTINT